MSEDYKIVNKNAAANQFKMIAEDQETLDFISKVL